MVVPDYETDYFQKIEETNLSVEDMESETPKKPKGGNMELEVGQTKSIPEGRHEGEVTKVNRRDPAKDPNAKFDYTDYYIKLSSVEGEPEIRYGVPTDIKVDQKGEPTTGHAKLLKALGFELVGNVDPEKAVGMKVTCLVQNNETDRGTFAEVVKGSIKVAE
jgi:hypothetical protein